MKVRLITSRVFTICYLLNAFPMDDITNVVLWRHHLPFTIWVHDNEVMSYTRDVDWIAMSRYKRRAATRFAALHNCESNNVINMWCRVDVDVTIEIGVVWGLQYLNCNYELSPKSRRTFQGNMTSQRCVTSHLPWTFIDMCQVNRCRCPRE